MLAICPVLEMSMGKMVNTLTHLVHVWHKKEQAPFPLVVWIIKAV